MKRSPRKVTKCCLVVALGSALGGCAVRGPVVDVNIAETLTGASHLSLENADAGSWIATNNAFPAPLKTSAERMHKWTGFMMQIGNFPDVLFPLRDIRVLDGEGEELGKDELHDAFEQALREGHLVPICFTSALTGAGLNSFLKLVKRLLPNPSEGNPPLILKGEGEEAEKVLVEPDPDGHVVAHVFKITNDPFVGKLSIFRIY